MEIFRGGVVLEALPSPCEDERLQVGELEGAFARAICTDRHPCVQGLRERTGGGRATLVRAHAPHLQQTGP